MVASAGLEGFGFHGSRGFVGFKVWEAFGLGPKEFEAWHCLLLLVTRPKGSQVFRAQQRIRIEKDSRLCDKRIDAGFTEILRLYSTIGMD